jgi:hypothetical protein
MQQRGQHRIGQRQSAGFVGKQCRRIVGQAGLVADQTGNTAGGLDHIVEGRLAGIGPRLTEAGRHAVNQIRLERRQRVIAQAESFDGIDPHVVNHDIDARQQAMNDLQTFRCLEINRERSFVAVDRQKDRAHAAILRDAISPHQIAGRRLDLDDVSAIVAEDLGGQRAENDRGEVEDAVTGERAGAIRGRCVHAGICLPD